MRRLLTFTLATTALAGLAACSQETQEDAARTADRAGEDIEANAEVVGEAIQDGAKKAAGAVSEGAADLEQSIEASDQEEPGPAPITGQDRSTSSESADKQQ